jgi:hypothetical protein
MKGAETTKSSSSSRSGPPTSCAAANGIPARPWKTPCGGCYLRLLLSGLEEIERWILSWGTHANVLRPAALSTRIYQTASELVQRYAPTAVSGFIDLIRNG